MNGETCSAPPAVPNRTSLEARVRRRASDRSRVPNSVGTRKTRNGGASRQNKRKESETRNFVLAGDCRSCTASTKPAISSFCALSNAWASFCFASAETQTAEGRSIRRVGATPTERGPVRTLKAKAHSNLTSDIQKAIIRFRGASPCPSIPAPAAIQFTCRRTLRPTSNPRTSADDRAVGSPEASGESGVSSPADRAQRHSRLLRPPAGGRATLSLYQSLTTKSGLMTVRRQFTRH